MRKLLQRFRADDRGSQTIEFVIVFPLIMWFVMTIFETGFIATRMVMLEHGVDMAARDIRLGSANVSTHDELKDKICEHAGILIDCDRDLIVEVVEMDLNSAYPQNQPNCIDRTGDIDPTITFTVTDSRGQVVRRVNGSAAPGLQRVIRGDPAALP